ncbi:MAG: hypothetical protein ACFFDH_09130, partial [Promethearchaeota archaeon]
MFSLLFISNFMLIFNFSPQFNENSVDLSNDLKLSANDTKSKPLLVYQHATISNTFFPLSLPKNVSYTLLEDWVSENTTIYYEGVSHKMDWVINGTFNTGEDPWKYYTIEDDTIFVNQSWTSDYVEIFIAKNKLNVEQGSYGYYEENVSIYEPLASNTYATLSMDYFYTKEPGGSPFNDNISVFVSIDVEGVTKNVSTNILNIVEDKWTPMSVTYDLIDINQQLPNNATIRTGVYVTNDTFTGAKNQWIRIDNVELTLWTEPNQVNLTVVEDLEDNYKYGYQNITYGKGKTFIDKTKSQSGIYDVLFTISKNDTISEELNIYNITITSEAVKIFNSTIAGQEGTQFSPDTGISWETECSFSIPYSYLNNWAEIKKPIDWNITSVLDGYDVEKRESCIGIGLGSEILKIPVGILASGLWEIKAVSRNYITYGGINVWNGTNYIQQSNITLEDIFQINMTLNDTLPYENTYVNCTIKFPNGTIYWSSTKELTSYEVQFGDFTVGKNMTVGSYEVILLWTNNQSYLNRDKVGYSQFNFFVWHHTNLTAVDSYIERLSGDPLLIKVNFTDYDCNTYIDYATVTYNGTLHGGISGTMAYLGSGIYAAEVDTSGLALGTYFFSVNASKIYFENQSINNLIVLVIIEQPIALEVPSTVINANSNNYSICNVNVTGALTHTLIPGKTNISTDWHKPCEILNGTFEGTYILNFSTYDVPTQGTLETYTIKISANKTNYGSTSAYISLTVHPIPTIASVNKSLIDVYFNENFSLEVNYTVKSSSEIITGAEININWSVLYDVSPTINGFVIKFSTEGLSLDVYTLLIQLNHPGYETAFKSVYVNVIPKSTALEIFLNQINKTYDKSISISWSEPLNITIFYKDSIKNSFITNAEVEVNGTNISEYLYQNISRYSIIYNSGELPVGIHFLTVVAQKNNYSKISSVLQITVNAIPTTMDIYLNQFEKTIDPSISIAWNKPLNITIFYRNSLINDSITGAKVQINGTSISESLYQNIPQYSIIFNPGDMSIGIHFISVIAQKDNYDTISSVIKITVDQIEIKVETMDFNNTLEVYAGKSIDLRIKLSENNTGNVIENANVTYSWRYAQNIEFHYIGNGIYETNLDVPDSAGKSYTVDVKIFIEGGVYKNKDFSFIAIASKEPTPNYLLWILTAGILILVSILSVIGVRHYVLLPKKREKESNLLARTQKYKDLMNIEAILVAQRESGLYLYLKSYYALEKYRKELLSGFIHAITTISKEIVRKDVIIKEDTKLRTAKNIENLIELDFNQFQFLIGDYKELRAIFILKDKASERFVSQLENL